MTVSPSCTWPLTVPLTWKRAKGSVMDVVQRVVGIERIQLEQDSGKSVHTLSPTDRCRPLPAEHVRCGNVRRRRFLEYTLT